MVKLPTQLISDQREQYRMVICGKRMQRKRRAEQLSLGNVKIIDLKLIKHDEALEDLKKNSEAPERLWILNTVESYNKGNIARLWSSRQRNVY